MNDIDEANESERLIQNAYSYVRLSSKQQLRGSGVARQSTRTQAICQQKGWKLSTQTFQDLGVSAFTGKNLLKGALAEFIGLAKTGKLAPNPVLILEAWDRFSRQDIDASEAAVLELLRADVAIHIAFANRTFTAKSAKDLTARIEILVAMKGAFDYSANISRRVKSAKARKIAAVAAGTPVNIQEMAPRWLTWNPQRRTFETNDKAEVVRTIFVRYLTGASIVSIVKELNEGGVPAFRGGVWHTASVRFILGARTVLGEFKGTSYFPRVVNEVDFRRAQVLLEKNRSRRGKAALLVNLFRGMVHCAECGFAVSMTKNKGRNYAYYRCTHAVRGVCSQRWLCRTNLLEEDFFVFVLRTHPETLVNSGSSEARTALESLRVQKQQAERKREAILELSNEFNRADLRAKYAEFDGIVRELDRQIAEASGLVDADDAIPKATGQLAKIMTTKDDAQIDQFMRSILSDLANRETRQKLATLIPSIVKRIELDFTTLNVRTTFTNGKLNEHVIAH